MNFSVWWNKNWHDKSWPSGALELSFREVSEDAWNAALRFAQQPQGAIPPKQTAPHAADVVRNTEPSLIYSARPRKERK